MYPLIHVQVVNWNETAENSCNWNDCVAGDDCGSTQLRDVPFHQRIWRERSGRQVHQSHRRLLWTRGEPSDPEANEAQWATVFPWKSTARCKVTYSNSFASTILLVDICGYGSLGSPCIRKCFSDFWRLLAWSRRVGRFTIPLDGSPKGTLEAAVPPMEHGAGLDMNTINPKYTSKYYRYIYACGAVRPCNFPNSLTKVQCAPTSSIYQLDDSFWVAILDYCCFEGLLTKSFHECAGVTDWPWREDC